MPWFRPLTVADARECFLIVEDLAQHCGHPIGGQWTLQKLTKELESGCGYGVTGDGGGIEAFCLFRDLDDRLIEITLLATAPRLHRTGAMRALIRSLIKDIRPHFTVWLEVHAGNLPAVSLYESLGFEMKGERPQYYSDGGKALLFEYKPLQ